MKKRILTILFALTCVSSFAQLKRTVTFDFTKPSSLSTTPELLLPQSHGETRTIVDTKFFAGDIEMSFKRTNINTNAYIYASIENGIPSYYMRFDRTVQWKFEGKNGATLNSLTYPMNDWSGGLYLDTGQQGKFDESSHTWKGPDNGATSVTFQTSTDGANAPLIHSVTVTYTAPSNVLVPTASIEDKDTVASFKEMRLDFGRPMSVASTSGITLSNGQAVKVAASGNEIVVSVDEAIKEDGTYTLTIPERRFSDAEGYENKALSYTFVVRTPKDTFSPVSVSPTEGETESLQFPIRLTFSGILGSIDPTKSGTLYKGETPYSPVKFRKAADDDKVLEVYAESISHAIKDAGAWRIDILERTVYDAFGKTYNPRLTYRYTIKAGDVPDTPKDSELMKTAKALLEKTGIGYPSVTSASRKKLGTLTQASPAPSDETLKAAMGDFYNETDVTLPEDGKNYQIYAASTNDMKAYLAYDGNTVTVSEKASAACAFKAEVHGGSFAFRTPDGKYLRILNNSNNYDDGKTTDNVTDAYVAVNDLTVSKLQVAGADSTLTFGRLSVYGSLGKNLDSGKEEHAFARVRFLPSLGVATPVASPECGQSFSCAFFFTEARGEKDTTVVSAGYRLTPDTLQATDSLFLSLTSVKTVKANRNATVKVSILNAEDQVVISNVNLAVVAGRTNTFVVGHDGCTTGAYKLVLPEGLFSYTSANGGVTLAKADTLVFVVKEGPSGFKYLDTDYPGEKDESGKPLVALYPSSSLPGNIVETDLNNYAIYYMKREVSGIVADHSKVVRIYKQYSTKVVATGHFEETEKDEAGIAYYGLKLVLDRPIKPGELESGYYTIVYEEATYGDANFGKYLKDPSSVKRSQCRVNPSGKTFFEVTNSLTGIHTFDADEQSAAIYDLQGRRLERITRPGIYIVNGRKVVRK